MKKGKITPNGVILESHEYKTVVFLTSLGYDVELLPPVQSSGVRTPDIKMNGLKWEMKSPKGSGKRLIQKTLHKAVRQSPNVILDIRRLKIKQDNSLPKIQREFELSKGLKRLKIIARGNKMLDFKK